MMAPTATSPLPPPPPPQSALQESLDLAKTSSSGTHPAHLHTLALTILHNLRHQHDWTSLAIHTHSSLSPQPSSTTTEHSPLPKPLPRPLISGLPPRRTYIHPDEQIAILKAEHSSSTATPIAQLPEREWVVPTHWEEKLSVGDFVGIFDAVGTVPPMMLKGEEMEDMEEEEEDRTVGWEWRGNRRRKRMLLATLHGDSTVVYYLMHEGIVKPRQN